VLVVCSLVAGRGLMKTFSTRPGFDAKGLSVVALDPIMASYSPEKAEQFQRRALEAVSQLPGVIGAAYAGSIPMTTDQSNTTIYKESDVERRMEQAKLIQYFHVSPGYFQTMGTRLLAGREFDWRAPNPNAPVAIVNETFARQIVGTVDAVGKHFRYAGGLLVEIIGVAEDGKYFTFTEEPKPVMYQPIVGSKRTDTYLLVRSSRPESDMAADMARVVKSLDPAIPVYGVGRVIDLMGLAFLPAWISSIALGAFGLLGMMLAVMGIYGLASYSVARRVREIGIRMAIGARPGQVLQSVLGRVALLVGIGSMVGLALGLASGGVMSKVVYQASPSDPLTLVGVAVLMLAIALGSTLGPIRRAVTINPLRALRQD
jgi:predicted permease